MAPFIRNTFLRMKRLFISNHRSAVKPKIVGSAAMLIALFGLHADLNAQTTAKDSIPGRELSFDEVIVSAIRVTAQTPVTFSNLKREDFISRNLGQDIPIMMNFMPSVVTTSDAGAGIGYTGIRVRGSDATRVNVTINGIPYNDAESQGTFWVNLGDFVSNTESIQLQRGVGTSTNGAGAFGASLNLLTDSYSKKAYAELANSVGSFNTRKHTVKFSTGLMDNNWEFSGRFSNVYSDGYIDRAFADLKGYFLQGTYVGETTKIKAITFGGVQQTYQAWYGLEDPELLRTNRTFNVAGMFFDADGNMQFYDNEVDNYQQDHFQLHWIEKWSEHWRSTVAFHYTKGKGYFEQFRQNDRFSTYGLIPLEVNGQMINRTDLIRRRWLDNDFWGVVYSAQYSKDGTDVILGGGANRYIGDHFGEIIWARFASQSNIRDRYYEDVSTKDDVNFYGKVNQKIDDRLSLFGDLQYRYVHYTANAVRTGDVNDTFHFFNPKAGATYELSSNDHLYFSFARAHREPNRNDYAEGSPRPERLDDFELGWRYATSKLQLNVNGYYMLYKDQLVLTGEMNDVGAPIRTNSGRSYRLGLEIDATIRVNDKWFLQPNVALSDNRNRNFFAERNGELQNFGNTQIAFSPWLVSGARFMYMPMEGLQISWFSKYVSEQFMSNLDLASSRLESYFVNDLNASYEIKPNRVFKSIIFSGLINNIFDVKYISNGFFYSFDTVQNGVTTTIDGAGFFPQATRNFLLGCTLVF